MPWVLIAFVCGTGLLQLAADLPTGGARAIGAACGIVLAAAAWRAQGREARGAGAAWLVLAALLLGGAQAAWRAQDRLDDALATSDEGRDLVVTGVVASLPQALERGVRFTFDVEAVEGGGGGSPEPGHVPAQIALAFVGAPADLAPAQRWRFTVRLRRPHGPFNPEGFDVEGWLFSENIRATGYVRTGRNAASPVRLAERVDRPGLLVDRARHAVRAALASRTAGLAHAGVLVALVVGDQRAIPAASWALFNRTGISHLISISGLHITMIAAVGAVAAAWLWGVGPAAVRRVPRPVVAACAGVLAAFAYCLLAGWGVPAQRTFLMIAAVAACRAARRRFGAATTLAAAAACVCVLDPWAVTAAGFWLSFGAVAGIFLATAGETPQATAAGPAHAWARAWHLLRAATGVQGAVTLALLPLTVVLFHQVSLVSPLANALAIPVVSYLVTPLALVGAACAMLPGVFDLPAVPLLHAAHGVFALLIAVLEVMDAWPAASVAIAAPPPLLLLPALAGVGWCLAPGWPLRPVGVLWLVPLVCWPAPRPSAGALWVTALDVGQGMAMVVQTASATVLYDTGPRYTADSDAGARVVLPWLRSQGIARLDALVLSHLDADHSGGYRAIAAALPVGDVLTSIAPDAALLGGRAVTGCAVGQRRRYGELVLEVLHPGADDPAGRSSTNARSCVVRAGAHGHHVLLTGDVPAAQEHVLLSRAGGSALAVDVLVAPHHGSRTSSTDALLVAAAPRWVAIQVGYRSRYGHPHRVVLDRLAAHGLPVLRTDHHGAIRWRFDADGTVNVDRQRLDHRRYWHDQPGGLASADSPAAGPAAPASSVDAVADEAGMSDDAPVRRIATPVNVDAPSSDLDPIGLPGP